MARLRVELYGAHVGDITGSNFRTFDFRTTPDAFEAFPLGSTILSESVPLEAVPNRGRAARRRNYFSELLPEGDLREYLADQAGLRPWDTVGFLARYGRDVAGAVQIYDPEDPGEPRTPFAEPVSEAKIAQMLRDIRGYPLGNTARSGKSLINGVQAKLLLVREGGAWKHPGDGYASTHILKPQLDPESSMVFDEEYGARILRRLGLSSHDTAIEVFDGVTTLVVERYDRSADSPDGRIHQEDMNQVLGAAGSEKYQKYSNGTVTLRRVAQTFGKTGDMTSLIALAEQNVLAVAIGNLDLHAKNISLLHPYSSDARLAPAYDMVPMAHLDNDHELALFINGVRRHAHVTADDLVSEFEGWGLRTARDLVRETLDQIHEIVRSEPPAEGAYPALQDDVLRFTTNLIHGKAADG